MKLRVKLLLLTILPLIITGCTVFFVTSARVTSTIKGVIENDLKAVATMLSDNFSDVEGNNYYVDDAGNMWNNDMNITMDTTAVDKIKADCGVVATIFYGDTRYMTSIVDDGGNRVVGTKAGEKVIQTVLVNGQEYFAENVDIQGEDYFAYYIPLYNADSTTPVGMVFTGMSQEAVQEEIYTILSLLMGVILFMILCCGVVAVLIANKIIKRVEYGVNTVAEVAQGNLTVSIDEKMAASKDEIGDLVRAIAAMKDKLVVIVRDIIDKSSEVSTLATGLGEAASETANAIEQVEKAVTEVADGATAQAGDTQQATENVIVMGNLVEETNDNVSQLNIQANAMEKSGITAQSTLTELQQINEQAKESIDVIYTQTNTTNDSAKKISTAINLITSIAEETNLLSLNASIEAARAGEQGRGFAVVASQIQKLAEQSNDSAKQIEEIVTSLMADSQKAVETMDEVKVIMGKQSDMVEKTGQIFGEVLTGIQQSRESVSMIAQTTRSLDETRGSVVDIVQNLSAIAEENAASTEETSASTTEVSATVQEMTANALQMQGIAEKLEESVKIFRIE